MTIRISDREASILLGATLMHWGVPFHRVAKRDLSADQQTIVDEASEKLISLREACQRTHLQEPQDVAFSNEEAALLLRVVEDCLNECGNESTELSLQLKTRERKEVEDLIDRIHAGAGPGYVKLI